MISAVWFGQSLSEAHSCCTDDFQTLAVCVCVCVYHINAEAEKDSSEAKKRAL